MAERGDLPQAQARAEMHEVEDRERRAEARFAEGGHLKRSSFRLGLKALGHSTVEDVMRVRFRGIRALAGQVGYRERNRLPPFLEPPAALTVEPRW